MAISKICSLSGEEFSLCDTELDFLRRMDIPPPDFSPAERQRRRLAWASSRTLHRRTCDATGKNIISMYAPDAKHPVYHSDYWWSDNWDPLQFGRDIDFGSPFFEQFDSLLREVPALHYSVIHSENCEFINMAGHCKNCYLSFFLDYCEDCFYVQDANRNRACVDCLGITNSELCYECVDCDRGYMLSHSLRSVGCNNSWFLTDCRGCESCIGCFNLTNKKHHIFNKPVSPGEFEAFKSALQSRKKVNETLAYTESLSASFPKRYYFGHSNEDFTGDNVRNVRHSYNCFHCHELENVRYADYFFLTHNSQDVSLYGNKSEWLYNCLKTGDQCSNNICCLCCWTGSSGNTYCHLVINTKDCFGCSGLSRKQYCILNKQYSAEEYRRLRTKLIAHMKETGEWGTFFPIHMSPFGYNESFAQVYYPLTKEVAVSRGYTWRDSALLERPAQDHADIPPDTIAEVPASILDKPLICEHTKKAYRITQQELSFYQQLGIPLPALSPDVRHERRFAKRNPLKLWKQTCSDCSIGFETSFPPTSSLKILCEACFQKARE